jgi:DNA-binding MurR/RpiR family transcriptional regulator
VKLLALVQATPDASEDERARELAEQHVIHVSRSTVNRTLRRFKITQ